MVVETNPSILCQPITTWPVEQLLSAVRWKNRNANISDKIHDTWWHPHTHTCTCGEQTGTGKRSWPLVSRNRIRSLVNLSRGQPTENWSSARAWDRTWSWSSRWPSAADTENLDNWPQTGWEAVCWWLVVDDIIYLPASFHIPTFFTAAFWLIEFQCQQYFGLLCYYQKDCPSLQCTAT